MLLYHKGDKKIRYRTKHYKHLEDKMQKLTDKEFYKEKIINMVGQIENLDYLEFIYNMMIAFKEKWGI